jgi:hypothetical protein
VVHATCDATTDKRRLTPFHNAARHVKNDLLEDNVDLFILEGRRQKLLQADVTRLLKGEIIEERETIANSTKSPHLPTWEKIC